jgi:predicted dehydrogenase
MVDAAEEAGVHLMVDFHARWHPLFMGAKGYVERARARRARDGVRAAQRHV